MEEIDRRLNERICGHGGKDCQSQMSKFTLKSNQRKVGFEDFHK